MKRLIAYFVASALLVGAIGRSAPADMMPSYRGDPNSVFVHWDTGPGLSLTEFVPVFDGFPLTSFNNGAGPGEPTLEIIPLGAAVGTLYKFFVPNFLDPLPLKDMRIQVFHPGVAGSASIVDVFGTDPAGSVATMLVGGDAFPGGFLEDWALMPNPDWEIVDIFAATGSELTEVIIDSVTIPEPSTLILGGMAGTFCLVGYGWRGRSRARRGIQNTSSASRHGGQ